jgi:hypothetical protein
MASIHITEIDGLAVAGARMLSECLFTLSREANAQQPQPGSGRSNHRQEDLSDLHEE